MSADAADIWHEDLGRAGDVRIHVPGIRPRIGRGAAHLVNMRDPDLLGVWAGFYRRARCEHDTFRSLAATKARAGRSLY